MPYYAVDRIEGKIAVLVADDGTTVDLPRQNLPGGAREGSILQVPVGLAGMPEWARAVLDEAEKARRMEQVRETLGRLRKHDAGGDILL